MTRFLTIENAIVFAAGWAFGKYGASKIWAWIKAAYYKVTGKTPPAA